MRRTVSALALAGSLLGGACTFIVPANLEQCATNADCVALGPAWADSTCRSGTCVRGALTSDKTDSGAETTDAGAEASIPSGPWGCVGRVTWPLDTTGAKRFIRNRIVDVSEKPVAGVSFVGCGKLDPECSKPITEPVLSDADGVFTINLPRGFDGFLKATPAAPLMPAIIVGPPLYDDLDTVAVSGEPLHAVAKSDIDALLALVGSTIDESAGHLFVQSLDCEQKLASGVTLGISLKGPNTKNYYYAGGLPNTDALTTDGSGLGGFVNVPPGNVVVTGRNTLGQLFATRQVILRAGTVTYLTNTPSP